jgi:hypothetical protein
MPNLNREDIEDVKIVVTTKTGSSYVMVPNEEVITPEEAKILRIVLGEVAMLNHKISLIELEDLKNHLLTK